MAIRKTSFFDDCPEDSIILPDPEGECDACDQFLYELEQMQNRVDDLSEELADKTAVMIGATSSAAGKSGLVPQPTIPDRNLFLRGDGSWASAGGGTPYSGLPEMDGVASAGSSAYYARGNHVHPTDTSRLGVNDTAVKAAGIPYGECDPTSTSSAFTATVADITGLSDGTCVLLKNGVVTSSASGFTLNVNGLGAKPVYASSTGETETTAFSDDSTALFVYSSTYVSGGAWLCYRGFTQMTILSYGNSTWADFLAAYRLKSVVYCRASSNSNPATGEQTRQAFMAYVNNASNPTEVEFQYYRSMSAHTASQQTDQVYIYKLTSGNVWSVTMRNASSKIAAGTGLTSSYSNNTLTLSRDGGAPGTSTPLMDGTAAVGTSDSFAREDHVHPSDTNKLDLSGGEMSGDIDMMDSQLKFRGGTYGAVFGQANGARVYPLATPTQDYDASTKKYVDDNISTLTSSIGRLRQAQASAAIAGGASGTIDMSDLNGGQHRAYLVFSTSNSTSPNYDYVGLLYLNTSNGTTHVLDIVKGSSTNVTFSATQNGVITATNNMSTYCRVSAVQIYG